MAGLLVVPCLGLVWLGLSCLPVPCLGKAGKTGPGQTKPRQGTTSKPKVGCLPAAFRAQGPRVC